MVGPLYECQRRSAPAASPRANFRRGSLRSDLGRAASLGHSCEDAAVGRTRAALLLLLAGCAPSVPNAPSFDGNVRRDAIAIADGAIPSGDGGYVRPDAPALPPADLDVTLPYHGAEATTDLDVSAALGRLDVVFSIDATGSYGGEIDQLQSELVDVVVPGLRAEVTDVAFAVARFEDAPLMPFGNANDHMYTLFTGVTTDVTRVAYAVAQLDMPLGDGGDEPEAGIEALFQIARGTGLVVRGATLAVPWAGTAASGGGTAPGVGFRAGAFRVVVHATDAPSHDASDYGDTVAGAHSRSETLAALRSEQIRVIGIASSARARPDLESFARTTGAVAPAASGECATGVNGTPRPADPDGTCPLVFDIASSGSGLSTAIVSAIGDVTDALTYDAVWGAADDDRLGFVQSIEATMATPPSGGTAPTRADLHPSGDGVLDTFVDVRSGTSVVFRAHLQNLSVEPADYDQVFRVTIVILGDGLELVRRTIRITVPRGRLDAGIARPDAFVDMDAGNVVDASFDTGGDGG